MNVLRYSIRKYAEVDFGAGGARFGDQFFSLGPGWRKELVTASLLFNSRGYGSTVSIDEGLHFDQRAIVATFVLTRGSARPSVPGIGFYDWLCQRYPLLLAGSECALVSVLDGSSDSPAGHGSAPPGEPQQSNLENLRPEDLGFHPSCAADSAEGGASSTTAAVHKRERIYPDDPWERPCPDAGSCDSEAAFPDAQVPLEDETFTGVGGAGERERDVGEGVPFSLDPPPTKPAMGQFLEVFVEDDEEAKFVLSGDVLICLVAESCDALGARHLANGLAISQDDGFALLIASHAEWSGMAR